MLHNMLRAAHVVVLDRCYDLGTVHNVISPLTAFNNPDNHNQLNLIPYTTLAITSYPGMETTLEYAIIEHQGITPRVPRAK